METAIAYAYAQIDTGANGKDDHTRLQEDLRRRHPQRPLLGMGDHHLHHLPQPAAAAAARQGHASPRSRCSASSRRWTPSRSKYKKYKVTDPKRNEMNAEIMAAEGQRRQHVRRLHPDPHQLPLLFAFFTMMTKVVELRQAHWFWLPNLQAADPYHILPIVMVVTPVPGAVLHALARRRSPAAEDDGLHDARLLRLHHLELRLRPGALLERRQPHRHRQQAVMNRTSLGREMREIAAKRARRKAAASKQAPRATTKTIQGRR
jgi:hypothetical protein